MLDKRITNPRLTNEKIARRSKILEIMNERFNPNFWANEYKPNLM